MPISNANPITQPAANFSSWWFKNIRINSPAPNTPASAVVVAIPYDPTTGLIAKGNAQKFIINDLFGAASVDTVTGTTTKAAITALMAALEAIMVQKGLATVEPEVQS